MKRLIPIMLLPCVVQAQGTRTDYARAEQLLGWNAQELVLHDAPRARWLAGATDRFWYRNRGEKGYEFLSPTQRPVPSVQSSITCD